MVTYKNFDLTAYNSYRIKASCAIAYFPESAEDFTQIFKDGKKKIILGGGYNTILSKEYYEEAFVIFDNHFAKINRNENLVQAEAGIPLYDLSLYALDVSLSGLETFYDIPSSLGGAVVMNAGAGGEEIKDILVDVDYFDTKALTYHHIKNKDISFEYRNSFFQKNPHLLIIAATLKLQHSEPEVIQEKMERIKAARWAKQPKEFPNAGSVFKRPHGKFVGPMIEALGLKGYSIGGAQVSEKHAGFIVNFNNAKGKDILDLIEYLQLRVKEEYALDLEVEQRII